MNYYKFQKLFFFHYPPFRFSLCPLALPGGGCLELERVADSSPLGVPLPDPREHPPVATGGLHLRPDLHPRHPGLPAPPAVRPRR